MTFRNLAGAAAILVLAGCTPQYQGGAPAPVGPSTLNVADAAIAGGDPNMALSVSQSVLQTDPNNVDALVHEGDAYYALQRCPAAQAAYELALKVDGKATAAEVGLGRCLIKTDPKAAEAALLAAIQDDPGNAAALNDLGISRDLQGNFGGAVDPYQKALLAQPGMTAAEINLGLSLALSGNGPAALQYLGPLATGQSATPKIREDYAAALVASGREADARQILSIDLTQDQVQTALDGFNAIIAGAQTPIPANPVAEPAPAVAPAVATAPVASTALPPAMPAASPAAAASPADLAAADAAASADPNAAYVGPSPIAGAISSSTPLPGQKLPQVVPAPTPAPTPAPIKAVHAAVAMRKVPNLEPNAAPAAASSAPAPAGGYQVQLGALATKDDAQSVWSHISGAMPALFGDKQADIETATVNGKTFYRLRTGSFGSKAEAARFCGEVSAAGNACTMANF